MESDKVQLFEDQPIRTAWVEKEEEWYFSVVDVVGALTEQSDYEKARKYWNKLKQRLKEEGSQLVTNCHQLKMIAQDGIMRLTEKVITMEINKENLEKPVRYMRRIMMIGPGSML